MSCAMPACKRHRYAFHRMHEKSAKGEKIRVGFGVVFDSVFPLEHVFELMSEDNFFAPFLIVIPDTPRGKDHMLSTYIRTCASLEKRYPNSTIVRTFDPRTFTLRDVVSSCDLYCPSIPYDTNIPPTYWHECFWHKSIPVFYMPYGPSISNASVRFIREHSFSEKYWRFYAHCQIEADMLSLGNNMRISGFAKLDGLGTLQKSKKERKKIIIAPHHTIFKSNDNINCSHFLQYSDLISRLPSLFPQIDFVFRPHPLLRQNLYQHPAWGKEKTLAWFSALSQYTNVEMQEGGEFLTAFVTSDAMIHDCASFIAEYLFTENPYCYMWDEESNVFEQFSELGKECLGAHYIAKNEQNILDFINAVIINDHDTLSDKRKEICKRLKHNHPHCSQYIVEDIKKEITDA